VQRNAASRSGSSAPWIAAAGLAALVAGAVGCEAPKEDPAPAPDPGPILFDPLAPTRIALTIDEADLEALRVSPREYVPATFALTQGEQSYEPIVVGIALKGNEAGSFRSIDQKAAFKIKFNTFVRGQRFLGLKGIKLNNMVEDPSMTHEAMSYAMLGHLGIPAARAGYAFVVLNGQDYGLHASIERLDDIWAELHFSSTQHLYEALAVGVDVQPGQEGDFEADEGPPDDRGDLLALIEAASAPDGAFLTSIRDHTRFEELVRVWAASQYLAHWDGYAGAANNYYLHSDDDGRFTIIPSGLDQSLEDVSYDLKEGESPYASQGYLFRRCRHDADCDAALDRAFGQLRRDLASFDALGLFDALVGIVEPLAAADSRREVDLAGVHAAQEETRRFLVERPAVLPAAP
jgi:hypothetical protein